MIHSQEVALRCAAAMPKHLLSHRHVDPRKTPYKDIHISRKCLTPVRLSQLDACKDDAARRLITGRSR